MDKKNEEGSLPLLSTLGGDLERATPLHEGALHAKRTFYRFRTGSNVDGSP